jgi:hypothetical protein
MGKNFRAALLAVIGVLPSVAFADSNTQKPSIQDASPAGPTAAIDPSDLTSWRDAERADTKQAYQAYLLSFPNGWFKAVAEVRVQNGLPTNTSPIPFTPNRNSLIFSHQRFVTWDRRLWQSAQSIATHNAYRDYLLLSPFGNFIGEAAAAYQASLPKLPRGIPVDCDPIELKPRNTSTLDFERLYPREAVYMGLEAYASGDLLIDYTGRPIGFVNVFHTSAEAFRQSIDHSLSQLRFAPLRTGCTPMPLFYPQTIQLTLNDGSGVSRASLSLPTPERAERLLEVGVKMQLTLPFDRALKLEISNSEVGKLYKITTVSPVGVHVATSRDEAAYSSLQWRYLRSGETGPVFLRVAALEVLPGATEVPLEISIDAVPPQTNLVAIDTSRTATPPTAPATPPPKP